MAESFRSIRGGAPEALSDQHDRHRGKVEDLGGNGPHHHLRDGAQAVCSHDDLIAVMISSGCTAAALRPLATRNQRILSTQARCRYLIPVKSTRFAIAVTENDTGTYRQTWLRPLFLAR